MTGCSKEDISRLNVAVDDASFAELLDGDILEQA